MCTLQPAAIYGTGSYAPEKLLTNTDFARMLETSDEWITTRTGIKERRIAAPGQATSDLCLKAAQAALENSGVKADELDLIIAATVTPDFHFPSTACLLQEKLGIAKRMMPCFDLSAACSGFIYSLAVAQNFVATGACKRVLIVGSEVLSRIVDYTDRATCILFGDAAGACVVGPQRSQGPSHEILSTRLYADGEGKDMLKLIAGGSSRPTTHATIDEKLHYLRIDGREVFRFGIKVAVELINDALARHKIKREDLGAILPHQANIRIIEAAAERLELPLSLFATNIQKYGNTSAASVPLVLDEYSRQGKLPANKPIVMLAFGAGLTWASAVVRW